MYSPGQLISLCHKIRDKNIKAFPGGNLLIFVRENKNFTALDKKQYFEIINLIFSSNKIFLEVIKTRRLIYLFTVLHQIFNSSVLQRCTVGGAKFKPHKKSIRTYVGSGNQNNSNKQRKMNSINK